MAYVIFKFVAGVMERIVEQNLLYDFYGELLNDHQKKIYEDAIYNDLSLSEIADEYGISRQGVHDLIFMKSRSYPLRFLKNFKESYYGIR